MSDKPCHFHWSGPINDLLTLQAEDMISAIKDKFGAMPVLGCYNLSVSVIRAYTHTHTHTPHAHTHTHTQEDQIIQQVQICLDLQYQPIDCPDATSSCKGDSVLYPQYKPWKLAHQYSTLFIFNCYCVLYLFPFITTSIVYPLHTFEYFIVLNLVSASVHNLPTNYVEKTHEFCYNNPSW